MSDIKIPIPIGTTFYKKVKIWSGDSLSRYNLPKEYGQNMVVIRLKATSPGLIVVDIESNRDFKLRVPSARVDCINIGVTCSCIDTKLMALANSSTLWSIHDNSFEYVIGKNAVADGFTEDGICGKGIHGFLDYNSAANY